ncbi:hypothetical protein GCM10027046_30600 [Uliginosibacterium flavum]|uniref:Uncharacterized protein n=1 Tax=Uliginosibacterium flavum TaxID=1396831 RepID=A0ABV2TH99_9RHOO
MWIFLNDAYLSVVDKGDTTGQTLLVRARHKGDIERVFPQAQVQVGGGTDYKYRARIDREAVALRMADAVRATNYGNFKSSVKERPRHDAYMGVWEAMYAFQAQECAK